MTPTSPSPFPSKPPSETPARRRGRSAAAPRWYSERDLADVGIESADAAALWFRCRSCHNTWSPRIVGGRMQEGWWHCPEGCNLDAGEDSATRVTAPAELLRIA